MFCTRDKTSSFPPALAQRMNQDRCPRNKTPGDPRPPSYQAEVFNPFVGQPAPPGHGHAAGPRAALSASRPTSSGGRGRSGSSGAAPWGGGGGGREGTDGQRPSGSPGPAPRQPGRGLRPEPALPGASAAAGAGSARRPWRPGPALRARAPRRACPLSAESLLLWLPPRGMSRSGIPEAAQQPPAAGPAGKDSKMRRRVLRQSGDLRRPWTHTHTQ